MKNLKVKSILFSLFAMMAVAVFLTSCEQVNMETPQENVVEDLEPRLDQLVNNLSVPLPPTIAPIASPNINMGSFNACDFDISSYGCDVQVNCAYHTFYNYYVSWFYNSTGSNFNDMNDAYCDYINISNECNNGNNPCP